MNSVTAPAGKPLVQTMIAAFLVLPLAGAVAMFLLGRQTSQSGLKNASLPVYGTAVDFKLTDQNGAEISRRDFLNSVWVADLIFTHCAGQCPHMSLAMAELQRSLPAGVRFASFSVDPGRDTPEVLAAYAKTYGAEKGRWFFLTGPGDEIRRTAAGFALSQGDDPDMHSTRFVLLDRESRIRGYYDQADPQAMAKLAQDASALLS